MTHVTRERLAEPGDHDALTRHVTRLVSTPLSRDAPLWHVHIIDGHHGGSALVARMHHCIADGVALFRVLLSLSDEAQDGRLGAPQQPRRLPARTSARRVGDAVVNAGKAVRSLAALVALPADTRSSLRTPLGTAKTVGWTQPLPLDAIKAAARAADATINDVVLAAVSAALRRRLDDGGRVADVRAILPVNLRPLDRTEIELGNRFGLVFLRLPLSAMTTEDRIARIQRRTAALKRSATAPVALAILRVVGLAPRRVVHLAISLFSAKASLVVTNVPGPQQPLHLGGRRIAGVIAWPPQSGTIGLGVSIISYDGQVEIGVMSDDNALPDPDALLADLRDELLAIGVETGGREPTPSG